MSAPVPPTGLPTPTAGHPGRPANGRRRDRRGRGMRGPALLPSPLAPAGVPAARSPKATFDAIVVAVIEELESRWAAELGLVEFAVEETPMVPDDWEADTVPLASLVRGTGGSPSRLVLFRRPIELRAATRSDLSAMVLTVLVEQVSELIGRPPEEVDPRYDDGDGD